MNENIKTPEEMRMDYEPDWVKSCETCNSLPTVPVSGLCGPCHFGVADTMGGDWWLEKNCDLNWELIE